jgi:hypothetical protein
MSREPYTDIHTHCQAAKASRTIQSLSKSVSVPTLTDGRKKSTIAQQTLCVIVFVTTFADQTSTN